MLFATKVADERAREESSLVSLGAEVDALLADAAQDLGLVLDVGRRRVAPEDEAELVPIAEGFSGLVLAPSLREREGEVELRLVLAEAGSRELRVRIERATREELPVRAVVALRDLVTDRPRPRGQPALPARAEGRLTVPATSAGRTSLAVNLTLFGGFVGYSIQRASGSEDPRLLYPLLAVGAGGGLVASVLAAEEWDVGVGDAWFVVGGAYWPTLAAHLIYVGRFGGHGHGARYEGSRLEGERWTAGLVAGTTGLTLATLGLSLGDMSEGGALLAHSGGGLGLLFGGVTEALVRGDVGRIPVAGMGYGTGLGWLGAAAFAVFLRPSSSRVVAADLGAVLGALGGAALGSPLLLDDPSATRQRLWAGLTGGMALAGAGFGWYLGRPKADKRGKAGFEWTLPGLPTVGLLGESVSGSRRAPVLGLSWSGVLR